MTDLRPYERLPLSRSAIDRAGRLLAYAEQERHLTGFLAPDAEEELERLEAAALAVLPQRKATR